VIELKDVWKIYQMGDVKVEALRGLNVKIFKGEFVAIQVHQAREKVLP